MAGKSNGKGKGLQIGTLTDIDEKPVAGGDGDNTIDQSAAASALRINGGDGNDSIVGTGLADRVNAGDGDDTVMGGAGDDVLFGNDGTDTAAYSGSIFNYSWEEGKGNTLIVTDSTGADGVDTLKHFEFLQFDDFIFDLNGANAAMILADDPQQADEDTGHSFGLQAWDFDGGSPFIVSISVTGGGSVSVVATGPLSQGSGSGTGFQVTFDPNGAYDYLAVGEAASETITVVVDDGQGNLSTKDIALTVTGQNDAPVIAVSASDLTGAVTEHADQTALENTTVHVSSGQVSFSDVDLSDTHTATAAANGADYRGAFSVQQPTTTSATTDGQIAWSFEIADADLDDLREGQVLTQSYDVTIDDGYGGTDTTTVTVTITGTNDAPIITSAAVNETLIEGDVPTALSASGVITFSDVDSLDSHEVTRGPVSVTGTLNGTALPYGDDGIRPEDIAMFEEGLIVNADGSWSFDLPASEMIDRMALGQVLTVSSVITVTDDSGAANASATQTLTVTLIGTNDAPQISSGVTTGGVSEIVDLADGENATTHEATGVLIYSDLDQADSHSASVTEQGAGFLGTLTAAAAPVSHVYGAHPEGELSWVFNVADSDLDHLAEGQVVTQTYTVTVTDEHGASASETVVISITGRNDGPVIEAGSETTGSVVEAGALDAGNAVASGMMTSSDVDSGASATWSGDADGSYGSFVIDAATGAWQYSLDNSRPATQALSEGSSASESFTVTVTDEHGASASETVVISITGRNDGPVIEAASETTGSVVEAGALDAGNAVASGMMTSSDVDSGASATWSGDADGSYGSFVIDAATGAWQYSLDNSRPATQALSEGSSASESFTVTVTDEHGASATETVVISITGRNDGPVIEADAATTTENGAITIDVLANDSDVDQGDSLTVDLVEVQSGGGTASVIGNQVFWDPGADYDYLPAGETATVVLNYTASDAFGASAASSISIEVTGTNDAASIAGDVTGTVEEDAVFSAAGVLVVSDADTGEALLQPIAAGTAGANGYGTFHVQADGNWTYALDNDHADVQALDAGQSLTDSIVVTSADGTATETITVTINGQNEVNAGLLSAIGVMTSRMEAFVGFVDGNGDGVEDGFAQHHVFGSGVFSHEVTSGDYDGDGDQDFVNPSTAGNYIEFYRNDGDADGDGMPTLTRFNIPTVSTVWGGVDTVDLDGDGDLDLFVGGRYNSSDMVMINTGVSASGVPQFASIVLPSSSGYSYGVSTGDINGDGHIDLLATNFSTYSAQIYYGLGDPDGNGLPNFSGAVQPPQLLGSGAEIAADIGDLNGDGQNDMVITAWGGQRIVNYNVGDTNGDGLPDFQRQLLPGYANSFDVKIADIDNDGDNDIVSTGVSSGTTSIYWNTGDSNGDGMIEWSQQNFNLATYSVEVRDWDHDGDGDLLFSSANGLFLVENLGMTAGGHMDFAQEHEPVALNNWSLDIEPITDDFLFS